MIGIAAVILLPLILALQNTDVVVLNVLFWKLSMSLVILILLTALIGLIAGYVIARALGSRSRG
jgi:uncharacterized integral membrane protein